MARINEIMAGTHRDQWKSNEWKGRRSGWLAKYGRFCRSCRREDVAVHVHHVIYAKGKQLHEATDDELTALCESCHAKWHAVFNNLKLGLLGHINVSDFARLAAGIMVGHKLHREAFFYAVAELASSPGTVATLACRNRDGGKP